MMDNFEFDKPHKFVRIAKAQGPHERTQDEMQEYLDAAHLPDVDTVQHYAEIYQWFATSRGENTDPSASVPEPLSEEAKQAYIDEHLEACAWCGQTREWHNLHPVRDHLFDPNERIPIEA